MSRTVFRVAKNKDNPYVMIDRRPIENPALSWRAKGVLAYLLSRPDDWVVRLNDLVKRSSDGVYVIRGALKELVKAGHVIRREERDGGKFKQYVLEVYELPFTSPPTNLSQAVKPQAINLMLTNTDSIISTDSTDRERDSSPDQFVEPTPFQIVIHALEKLGGGLNVELVNDWLAEHEVSWILKAIDKSLRQGARSPKYVDEILIGWKANGYPKTREERIAEKRAAPSQSQPIRQESGIKWRTLNQVEK